MKQHLYVIFDRTAQEGIVVFSAKNEAVAKRHFSSWVDGIKLQPEDFGLLQVAEYETEAPVLVKGLQMPIDVTPPTRFTEFMGAHQPAKESEEHIV